MSVVVLRIEVLYAYSLLFALARFVRLLHLASLTTDQGGRQRTLLSVDRASLV